MPIPKHQHPMVHTDAGPGAVRGRHKASTHWGPLGPTPTADASASTSIVQESPSIQPTLLLIISTIKGTFHDSIKLEGCVSFLPQWERKDMRSPTGSKQAGCNVGFSQPCPVAATWVLQASSLCAPDSMSGAPLAASHTQSRIIILLQAVCTDEANTLCTSEWQATPWISGCQS